MCAIGRENAPYRTLLSAEYSQQIAQLIPGGVNSPFRSFKDVGGHTIFLAGATGSRVYDVDGNEYIDYVGAWGPAILGHCPPDVMEACQRTLLLGPVLGAPHEFELKMAEALIQAAPSLEMVRFVNSGTEAVMSAVRLARAFTGKEILVMFEGCYHGHSDAVLASKGHCSSGGVPEAVRRNTVLARFNDSQSLEDVLRQYEGEVAAVIIEPVAGSMGVIPPEPRFLEEVAGICTKYGVLLIFDEVLTGLRVAYGGAQELFGVKADLTCFGKALGGGMPIGAFGGRRDIMQCLQPIGDVYQAGTFSGNPVTMAGGIETLRLLSDPEVYLRLESATQRLFDGLSQIIEKHDLPVQLQRVGSMFAILFCRRKVSNYQDSLDIDADRYARFFQKLIARGIYMPPSAVDAACVWPPTPTKTSTTPLRLWKKR